MRLYQHGTSKNIKLEEPRLATYIFCIVLASVRDMAKYIPNIQ